MPSRYYLTIESKENYFSRRPLEDYGFNDKHRDEARLLEAGDLLVDYITGCGYACIMEIGKWETGIILRECPPDFTPTSPEYPWRVKVKVILQIEHTFKMPKYKDLKEELECCHEDKSLRRPLKNAQWMRGKNLIDISPQDFETIRKAISDIG